MCAAIGDKEAAERPRHYVVFIAVFDRCRSMLGAVHLLVGRGFAHEALMLCRSLLTDSLTLAEIAEASEEGRAKLAVAWELHGLADLEGALIEEHARGMTWANILTPSNSGGTSWTPMPGDAAFNVLTDGSLTATPKPSHRSMAGATNT